MKKLIASLLTVAVVANTTVVSYASAASHSAGSPTVSQADKVSIIHNELKKLKSTVDRGKMSMNDATAKFANTLVEKDITVTDVEAYVATRSTPAEAKEFQDAVAKSMKNIDPKTMTAKETSQVLAQAFAQIDSRGLAWSGCAGATIGVILIIGAVVTGIVALTKTKGEARIRAQYGDRIDSRTKQYLNDKYNIENRPNIIQAEIASNNSQITQNNSQISYYNGMISGALASNPNCASTPECSQNIVNWTQKIQQLTQDNTNLANENQQLNLELAMYSDESYMAGQLASLQTAYNNDILALNNDMQREIDLVPHNKRLAKILGITAGVAGAIGIYFAIDGFQDC